MLSGHCVANAVTVNQGPTEPTDAATKDYVDKVTKRIGMLWRYPLMDLGTEVGEIASTAKGIHIWDGVVWKTAPFG